MTRSLFRVATAFAATVLFSVVGVGAASAHVEVTPEKAPRGGWSKLDFRVPTEKDAKTVKVKVTFPGEKENPLIFLAAKNKPNWDIQVDKVKLAKPIDFHGHTVTEIVRSITWIAKKGGAYGPDMFDEMTVWGGPLPNVDKIYFDAEQYYSDGEVVKWNQRPTAENPTPDYPAPSLELTAGASAGKAAAHQAADRAAVAANTRTAGAVQASAGSGEGGAQATLSSASAGAVVALGALGGFTLWRRRSVKGQESS
ncbi:YcnI family protein [Streptomyces coeruleorubidus]|uniref:YcnI family protein n=1 Tax=Streptomyces coeruleorubidus TaxID=116188 RepID=UPI0037A8E513